MASKLEEILTVIDTLSVEELRILQKRINELLAKMEESSSEQEPDPNEKLADNSATENQCDTQP